MSALDMPERRFDSLSGLASNLRLRAGVYPDQEISLTLPPHMARQLAFVIDDHAKQKAALVVAAHRLVDQVADRAAWASTCQQTMTDAEGVLRAGKDAYRRALRTLLVNLCLVVFGGGALIWLAGLV